MDARISGDVDRVIDRRIGRPRDQSYHGSGAAIGKIRTKLERTAPEFQIPRVPVRARRGFDRVLRGPGFRAVANWGAVSCDSTADWHFTHLRRSALFVRR